MLSSAKMTFYLAVLFSPTVMKSVLPCHFISDGSYDILIVMNYFTQQEHDLKYHNSNLT